jgi:hypothetical protein
MDSKNSNNNGEDGQQQLRRSSRIRKLNKLANEDKAAEGEVQTEPQNCSSSKNNRKKDRNHLDLEVSIFLFIRLKEESEIFYRSRNM